MKNKYARVIKNKEVFNELLEEERLLNMDFDDDLSDLADIHPSE